MNCRKYRACLVGVLAIALICGALLYLKYGREGETPVDGVLVPVGGVYTLDAAGAKAVAVAAGSMACQRFSSSCTAARSSCSCVASRASVCLTFLSS